MPDPQTKWTAIAASIRKRIKNGTYLPGTALPGAKELAGEYGVARNTMVRAIKSLAEDGDLTYTGPPPQYTVTETGSGPITGQNALARAIEGGTIHASGTYCTFLPTELLPCPSWASRHLGVTVDTDCVRRTRTHHTHSGAVYQASEQWLTQKHALIVPEVWQQARVKRGVWALLADRLGVEPVRSRDRISLSVNKGMAELLGVHADVRLLQCEVTIYGSDGTVLSCTRRYSTGDEPLIYDTEV